MAVTRDQVAELYVSYFGRAPLEAGLKYWTEETPLKTIEEIADSFSHQKEYEDMYGGKTTAKLVETVFQNVFERAPSGDGLVYWVNQIDDGKITIGNAVLAIVNGAQDTDDHKDKTTLENKVTVAEYFAASGVTDLTKAKNAIDNVDDSAGSVATAKSQIDTWAEDVADFTLTDGTDVLTGTDADETFKATLSSVATKNTLQASDKLDGAGGVDTLKITNENAAITTPTATVKNIEKLDIIDKGTGALTIDFANFDNAIKSVEISGNNGAALTLGNGAGANVKAVFENVELAKTTVATTTVNYENSAINGSSDKTTISLKTSNAQTYNDASNGVENYTIHTDSGSETLTLADTAMKTLKVDGGANLTLSLGVGTNPGSVDASALSGDLNILTAFGSGDLNYTGAVGKDTLTLGATAVGKEADVKTGAGDDNVIMGAPVANGVQKVDLGAGNDTIVVNDGGGVVNVKGGDGNDTITTTAAETGLLTIDAGAGKDTIVVNEAAGSTDTLKVIGGAGADTINLVTKATAAHTTLFYHNTGDTGIASESDLDVIGGPAAGRFATTKDKIDFDSLAAGTATNFAAENVAANYAAAKNKANDKMNGTVIYVLEQVGADSYLFVDADKDGTADEAIKLVGIATAGFAAGDIVS